MEVVTWGNAYTEVLTSSWINITDGFMKFHSETCNLLFLDLQALRGDARVVS